MNKKFYGVVVRSEDSLNGTLCGLIPGQVRTWTTDKATAEKVQESQQAQYGGGFYNYELVETYEPRDWKA